MRVKTTMDHLRFWQTRKIDWQTQYLDTWTHPHRALLAQILRSFFWVSLWEAGCGPGPNIVRFIKEGFEGKQYGGSDINPEAIELARKTFKGGKFHVEPIDDMLLSDGAVDVVLTDAALIYYGPLKIKKAINEIVRIGRNHILLCEFHGTSWWERLKLRLTTGYNAYNYRQLLEDAGCYDIQIMKIPKESWAGTPWEKWGSIILAKLPKK